MGAGPKNARGGPTGWVTAVDKVRAGLPEFLAHFLGTNLPRAFWSAHPGPVTDVLCLTPEPLVLGFKRLPPSDS
jgi:hypothetical protein